MLLKVSSRLFIPYGSRVLPLEIKNASLAFRMPSLLELMTSRGMSSRLLIEWPGRVK